MQKIQITLSDYQIDVLKTQAGRKGYPLRRYVKNLITDAVTSYSQRITDIPTFLPSKRTERALKQAEKEYKEGKSIVIKESVVELLD